MKPTVTVLGPLPPPYGGVSIHVVRFLELIQAEGLQGQGVPYTGTTSQGAWGKLRDAVAMIRGINSRPAPGAGDTVHLHYGGLLYFLAVIPFLRRTRARKVITFHSVRVIKDLAGVPGFLKARVLKVMNGFDLFVPVREGIGDQLRDLGLDGPAITIMPAFLPPADAERDLARLPEQVRRALEAGQEAGRLQVCVAAYYLGPGYGQEDLYGISDLAQALVRLDGTLLRPLDVWVLVSNRPETREQRQAAEGLQDCVRQLENISVQVCYGLPLIPVMARCGAFLRPSREDGDSVAIREALSMGLPVLASDVVQRPEGVATFTMNGAEGLAAALAAFLPGTDPVPRGQMREVVSSEREKYHSFIMKVAGLAD